MWRGLDKGGIALDTHETLEGGHHRLDIGAHLCIVGCHRLRVYFEESFVGVFQSPHQHEANHHRVALLVVHLDGFCIQVAGTQREFLGAGERVNPVVARAGEGAYIFAEEHDHTRLSRLQHHESRPKEERDDNDECTAYAQRPGLSIYGQHE